MRHIAYFGSKMEPLISAQTDAIAEAGVIKLHVPVSGFAYPSAISQRNQDN
jgi:hypothetical protein